MAGPAAPGRVRRGVMRAALAGAIVAVLGVVAALPPLVPRLEQVVGLTWLYRLRGPRPVPPDVLIVGIDRRSAEALGLPANPDRWPRGIHAALIDALRTAGAEAIVFDLFLREPGDAVQNQLLAAAMQRAGNVLIAERVREERTALTDARGRTVGEQRQLLRLPPHAPFAEAALGVAPFLLPVVPVTVSEFWTFLPQGERAPTMPVLAAEALVRARVDTLPMKPGALARAVAAVEADPARRGTALPEVYGEPYFRLLNFYGPVGAIPTVPYRELVTADGAGGWRATAPAAAAGRIVFVGFTEANPSEQKDTFFFAFSDELGRDAPGVELAATATANLLDGSTLRPVGRGPGLLLLVGFGLVAGAACRLVRVRYVVPVALLLAAGYAGAATAAFAGDYRWLPMLVPLLVQVPAAAFAAVVLRYRETRRQRDRIEAALGRYVPKAVIRRLADQAVGAGMAEQVYGICLVSDAAAYSGLSEQLPPQELRERLNRYYDLLIAPVERNGGSVSDIVGDSMLALWTDTRPSIALRRQALRAALDIRDALTDAAARGDPAALATRLALHAGEISLGDVGGGSHFEFRAVGDIVNTATRLESLNKPLGTTLLMSTESAQGLDYLAVRPLGAFVLAGKVAPLEVLEPWTAGDAGGQRAQFAAALALFQAEDWAAAATAFGAIAATWTADGPARYYAGVAARFAAQGADAWTGRAIRVTSK